jgi:2-C-methyl-D-erythritol 2,4-cyclodiphosphate synthase
MGHSDADVGIHALVDAILGSISQGDIGEHFPPTEKKWKNKNSEFFLEYTKSLMENNGFLLNNIDITVICERPKISKYKEKMKEKIAKILNIKKNIINIKGTTTEKLGFLGREEGIACQVSVSVLKKNEH